MPVSSCRIYRYIRYIQKYESADIGEDLFMKRPVSYDHTELVCFSDDIKRIELVLIRLIMKMVWECEFCLRNFSEYGFKYPDHRITSQ